MRAEELYGDHGYVYLGNGEFVPRDELRESLHARGAAGPRRASAVLC